MKIWNFWKGRCLISTWKNPYLIWFTLILFYHWLSDEEQLKTTAKVFSLLKQNELFLLSIAIEQARNVDLMLPYCSREMQQRIKNVVPYRPNQCYVELFTRSGSEIAWFGAEVIPDKIFTWSFPSWIGKRKLWNKWRFEKSVLWKWK